MKPQPYEFEFVGTQENSYIFETDNQVFYELAFKLFDYFFTDTRYSHKAYEFRIDVLWTSLEKLPAQDPRIKPTVAAIIHDFFTQTTKPIVLYVCESSDGKQAARSRLFMVWFIEYQTPDIFKFDVVLRDKKGEDIPISMLIQSNNPHLGSITEEFRKVIGGYHK